METNQAASIWKTACEHLSDRLSKDVYDRWIAVINAKELSEDTLVLNVANGFYQTWLVDNYLPLIEKAVSLAASRELRIEFTVDRTLSVTAAGDATPPEPPPVNETRRKPLRAARTVLPRLNEKYSFDRFVIGPSNRFAHAAASAVAQSPARAYNPLFIYGGSGLGKTHLMHAIGHYVMHHQPANVAYVTCEEFTNDYIDALTNKTLVQFRRKYRGIDLLLIDDVHFLGGKERMQEEFFHTFNALFENHKQIVMTSDRPASDIQGLEHRLVSRFEWGLVTELESPDIETRIAILRTKREHSNLQVDDDVLQFIAENIRSNIRRLEGALIRVGSYVSLIGKDIPVESLDNLLRDLLDPQQEETVSMESIQRAVAEFYDLRLSDMTSKRRPQSIAFPRQVAMYLCRSLTTHSLPEIGTAFAKNHATVLHACRLVTDRLKNDATLKSSLSQIRQRLSKR